MISDYIDQYGNITAYKNQQSENPLTFTAAFYFSALYNNANSVVVNVFVFKTKYTTNGNTWRTMEYDPNPDWSIDDKMSALAYFAYKNDSEWLKRIPIFPSWNNSSKWSWFRPDVLAYTIGSKWKFTRVFLWPIIWLKCVLSILEFEKHPATQASGAQLAFIKAMGWGRLKIDKESTLFWKSVFDNYYPMEPNHPTRVIWDNAFMGVGNER